MMRAAAMDTPVTYNLSSIDQSSIRTYIRYCLCFPCSNRQKDVDEISSNLTASAKRAISYLPILAGTVHPIPICSSGQGNEYYSQEEKFRRSGATSFVKEGQRGRVKVTVTMEQINEFAPTVKVLGEDKFPYNFEELAKENMPAGVFVGAVLTPLPDASDPKASDGDPVFAIQANFIKGGVLVVLQLHHSAVDIEGMAAAIRHMSISDQVLPLRQLSHQALVEDASNQDRMRDRLCCSRGLRTSYGDHPEYDNSTVELSLAPNYGACHVLSFSLEMLNSTRDLANERFQFSEEDAPVYRLSTFDTLAAILWKAVTRARGAPEVFSEGESSALLVPVNIGKKVFPPLEDQFYGNSRLLSHYRMPVFSLSLPFDVGTISKVALTIRTRIARMNEPEIRSAIAAIEAREDVRTLLSPGTDLRTDMVITDWSCLPVGDEASLGLGCGPPSGSRKPSRQHSGYECVLLPANAEQGVWEVLVQLTEAAMARLLEDPGLMPYIERVA